MQVRDRNPDWELCRRLFSELKSLSFADFLTLDIGARDGVKTRYIASSSQGLVYLDKKLKCKYPTSITADARSLPFGNNTFDAVILSHVIEHIAESETVLCEIFRVLKGKGFLILITPNSRRITKVYSLVSRIVFRRPYKYPLNPGHVC